MLTASSLRSAPGLARFRRLYAERSSIETTVVASRAVIFRSARPITSNTGLKVDPRRCGIWSCSVVGTTEAFTKKAFGSSDERMASFSSARPTVTCCRRFHRLQRHQLTLLRKFALGIQRLVLVFIRTRPRQGGMAGR
jgi:hypothetical protein